MRGRTVSFIPVILQESFADTALRINAKSIRRRDAKISEANGLMVFLATSRLCTFALRIETVVNNALCLRKILVLALAPEARLLTKCAHDYALSP